MLLLLLLLMIKNVSGLWWMDGRVNLYIFTIDWVK